MKLHWCSGDIYLDGYINININGKLAKDCTEAEIERNRTSLDKYFKYPFIQDPIERRKQARGFICDRMEDVLQKWNFEDNSVDEIVLISAFEHFYNQDIRNHVIPEISRVLKSGGKFITDFPDIKKQMELYYKDDPEFCFELIYCNHKDNFSIHHWGYNPETFKKLFPDTWSINEKTYVVHDYPMIGMEAIKN